MTSVFQLYGRPRAADIPLPPLRITGDLEGYTVGEPYEGRLQIIDSIGKCVVEIVESSLPPGSYAFVDNFTKEIVLRWPAYAPPGAMAPGVPNGDFEQGNDGSWRLGAGWSVEAGDAETGTYSGVFQNQRGISSIESVRVPYVPGTVINASVRFEQGASSSGNLEGQILLVWCDENGNDIPGGEGVSWTGGTLIQSGSNGEWRTSSVTGSSATAKTVAVGFRANRKKQNLLARVDNFTWDHTYSTGTNSDLDFTVTFKVADSANRVAYWTGAITVYVPKFPKFLLSGDGSKFSYSNDTGTAFLPAFTPTNWFSANYPVYNLNGRIFGVSSRYCRYSDDGGLSFTLITIPEAVEGGSTGIALNGVAIVPRAGSGVLVSSDAVNWVSRDVGKSFAGSMAAAEGIICALGTPNVPHVSTDNGATWTSGAYRLDVYSTAFNTGSRNCGAGFEGACYFGGEIWGGPFGVSAFIPAIARTTGSNVYTYERVHVAANMGAVSRVVINTTSVCVTAIGRVYYKPEGGSWTYSGFSLSGVVDILSYNNNVFLLGGGPPGAKKLYTSTTGASWTEITNPLTTSLGSLVLV